MTKMGRGQRSSEGGNTPTLPPPQTPPLSLPKCSTGRELARREFVARVRLTGRRMLWRRAARKLVSRRFSGTGEATSGVSGQKKKRNRKNRKIPAGSLSFLPVLAKKLSFTDKSLLLKNISASSRPPYGGSGRSARGGRARPEVVRGKFDSKGGEAVPLGRACEPCGHRTQRDSPRAGGARGRPLAAGGISLDRHFDVEPGPA